MTAIHHVNIVVAPGTAETVAAFYVEVFECRRIDKPAALAGRGGAWVDVDGFAQLHLSEREGAVHPASHFALVVDDFSAVLARLDERGDEWTDDVEVFGGRRARTRDPAGNEVEILERAGSLAG